MRILIFSAFLGLVGCANADAQTGQESTGYTMSTMSVCGMNGGCGQSRRRVVNRVGNDVIIQVGLLNFIPMQSRSAGATQSTGNRSSSGGKRRGLFRRRK